MASTTGGVAAEPLPSGQQLPAEHKKPLPVFQQSEENSRPPKRPRDPGSISPRSQGARLPSPLGSPAKSARLALSTSREPLALTGATALQDERRRREEELATEAVIATSENPSHKALVSLMSGVQPMSRAADAPQHAPIAAMETTTKNSDTLPTVEANPSRLEEHGEVSPPSTAGLGGGRVMESPTPMDVDTKEDHTTAEHMTVPDERTPAGSLSYPGSLQASANAAEASARGMSYPMPSQMQSSPSSGTKKHKCPHCNTEFTRHHNLKSHLLTHSQEKPYVCTDCQMRFRRLHDLKRHGKLHSGEKPHICPKCDRKFARGDALARHSKGAGGCAGRRSSMGSFADGDELDGGMGEGDDSGMAGLAYENGDDDDIRRQSLPSINTQSASGTQSEAYGAHSRTYPPAGPRHSSSGLYPPNVGHTQSSTNASTSIPNSMASSQTPNTSVSSAQAASGGTSMYSQAGMTESPKPLSPGGQSHDHTRQRSPGASQQVQQQQMGRQSDLQSANSGQARPKLPGLSHPGFAAPNTAAFSHNRGTGGPQPTNDSGNMFAQSDPSVWSYIQNLEEKIKTLSDKVISLDHEVVGLKKQLESRDTATSV